MAQGMWTRKWKIHFLDVLRLLNKENMAPFKESI